MNLYNKYYKSNYEELITYYPLFYKEVREMNEILKAQGKLADNLENSIEQIFSDCFIDTADKNVISSYERIIGIVSDNAKNLEERRSLVKSHLVGTGKISASLIVEMIKAYTGASSRCIFSNSCLDISVDRGDKSFINFVDISALLSSKLPAHIMFALSLKYEKSIVLSYNRKIYANDFPNCGQYFCGQDLML